jgi:tetratricopeptide (TPR) repeat protein
MDGKAASSLEKILILKNKGSSPKAIAKITDLIGKYRQEAQLYIEAIDICLEAGESLTAWKFFKKASSASSECHDKVWAFAKEKIKFRNDPVLAKLLMEQAIRKRDLDSGRQIVHNLENHTAKELLSRTHVKKKTLMSNLNGEYALKGDLLINIFSEALLLQRVGRTKEAMQALVHILDEKPIENDVIEPFLIQLEKTIGGNSSIYYALGCCSLISELYRVAITRFSQSIHINHAFLPDCIERIERIRHSDTPLPEDLELVLAEAYLMQDENEQASGLLHHVLDNQPEKAAVVLDLTVKYTAEQKDPRHLHFTCIEAAILSKQNNRAADQITELYENRERRFELLEWLDRKYSDHMLPSDILLYYGRIALQQRLYEKAIHVLTDVTEMSPVDVPAICRLLEEHRDANQDIRKLYDRLYCQLSPNGSDSSEIDHFEKSEFSFSSLRKDPSQPLDLSAAPLAGSGSQAIGTFIETETRIAEPRRCGARAIAEEPPSRISPEDFNDRYVSFLEGCMEDEEIISLIDDAFTQGENERLPRLLSFKPAGLAEEMQRKLHLTRFYLLKGTPLEALAVIKSIAVDSVPQQVKKDVLLKLAACYRRVHMYEAAHSALLKLKCEHPDSSAIDRLLKNNYSDYLNQQSSGAFILEKTGHID